MSIRELLADVLADSTAFEELSDCDTRTYAEEMASALLASPQLAAIVDLAAWDESGGREGAIRRRPTVSPEVQALLKPWRASRAERPTP